MAKKKWYYGPAKSQRHLNVFGSMTVPTENSHGHWIQYAVGPFTTRAKAIRMAQLSQAHPGWPVFLKVKGPYSIGIPKP
jgi:hypothetical protein